MSQTLVATLATRIQPPALRRAIGYIRVSTEPQAASGFGFEGQKSAIEAWAAQHGVEIMKFVEDQVSARGAGSFGKRRTFRRVLKIASQYGLYVVAAKPSRITRHASDLADITSILPGDQIFIAESGRTLDESRSELAWAEYEGDEISRLTSEGMQKKKREGHVLGSPQPEALQKAGREASSAKRQERVDQIADVLFDIGLDAPNKAVADEMNRRGYATAQGKPWNKSRIKRLVKPARQQVESQSAPDEPTDEEEEDPDEVYKNNPLYGRF